VRSLYKGLLWFFGISAALCGILYAFVLDVWTVPGDDAQEAASIEPTLSSGDVVIVWRSTGPDVGPLVRCADPDAPGRFVVGRVVGKAFDVLDIHDGMFLYNGATVSAPTACDKFHLRHPVTQEDAELNCGYEEFAGITHMAVRQAADPPKQVTVDANHIFLLSDNRMMHLDSRDFGQLQPQNCQRIAFRLWGSGGWFDAKRRFTIVW